MNLLLNISRSLYKLRHLFPIRKHYCPVIRARSFTEKLISVDPNERHVGKIPRRKLPAGRSPVAAQSIGQGASSWLVVHLSDLKRFLSFPSSSRCIGTYPRICFACLVENSVHLRFGGQCAGFRRGKTTLTKGYFCAGRGDAAWPTFSSLASNYDGRHRYRAQTLIGCRSFMSCAWSGAS